MHFGQVLLGWWLLGQLCGLPPEVRPVEEGIGYAFDRPAAVFRLPKDLKEISGLTVLGPERLGAIQDEAGTLYLIDTVTGAVEDERAFGKERDYEGIEQAGDRLFVLRSNGTLYEIVNGQHEKKLKTKTRKTSLSAKYDTEGLAFDASAHRLLIACKEYAGKGLNHHRAIYAFDLERDALVDDPVFVIDLKADAPLGRRIRPLFSDDVDLKGFKPSGLAVHPITRQIFVLSSVLKVVVVLDPDGRIAHVERLPEALFEQPEGIAFLPNGDLFISSEGVREKAVLFRFNYRKP